MKELYDVRSCRNCGTSFNWLRKDITRELTEGKITTWPEAVEFYGVNCCDNPQQDNDQWHGMILLEAE